MNQTLESLAAVANEEHVCGEEATRNGLSHFRNAGDALIQAKRQVGHGMFQAWVEANAVFSYRTARVYMLLAKHAEKWQHAASLRDALDLIANRKRRSRPAGAERPESEPVETEWIKYSLRATVIVTSDTDPRELEDLIRAGQVHWILKNERGKTLTIVRVEAVESLERLLMDVPDPTIYSYALGD
jgi:hypothetical protein